MASRVRLLLLALPALALVASTACVDEQVVYRDRQLFEQPDSSAMGFLGYTDVSSKLTVCGNCHVDHQANWEGTAHAHAWENLQASGHANASCEGCHTVGQNGNTVDKPAGFAVVPDERYHDVQCESCHGPGLKHVQAPDASTPPLAPISVGADLTYGCGECHQGTHEPFVEEWSQSLHAQLQPVAAPRPECQSCHEGHGALKAFGVTSNYLEKDDPTLIPITCAVCHDPHDATYEKQLRFPVEEASIETHLCARCHNRTTAPNATSTHGLEPHAPEAALLGGDAGWFPPGLNIDPGQIIATHGSSANPGLCATCHVNRFEVTDAETGAFKFQVTGHLFEAIPCLGPDGIPTAGDCALSTDARSFKGCTGSGCHGTEQVARSALVTATNTLQQRADELMKLLVKVDPNLDAAGGALDPTDGKFSVADGAWFNLKLAQIGGREDRVDPLLVYAGSAAHNPFLTEALLVASIQAVEKEYGVSASPGFVRTLQLQPPPRLHADR